MGRDLSRRRILLDIGRSIWDADRNFLAFPALAILVFAPNSRLGAIPWTLPP